MQNFKSKSMKPSDTAGLENILKLGINTKVMLRVNIDPDNGLANGTIGYIVDIKLTENGEVHSLIIQFRNIKNTYELNRVTLDFEVSKNEYCARTQFPLSLAWAITIHKVQGLSLNAILADIGSEIFCDGMSYVALSRAKFLTNVWLIDFDKNKLTCDQEAIVEYNRLKALNNKGIYNL